MKKVFMSLALAALCLSVEAKKPEVDSLRAVTKSPITGSVDVVGEDRMKKVLLPILWMP